ncbi:MAG: MlaD family protein [Spirochaetaceae bacterium]|jgi:phospholipid/cholesterol/gamma-HCH transport system substrate-binding protein|nr:MlaD family protein [Spirochaetaceae bacterium]
MKFRVRFADQIVGVFILIALASLVLVIFMLGRTQRWFAKDLLFKAYFGSAAGLSNNMPVQYKGFTIGNVKSFALNEADEVEVVFSIYEQYGSRVRQGSLVELVVSPLAGLGNQFLFYPGLGENLLAEGSFVPAADSAEGKNLIRLGLAQAPVRDDSITRLIAQVSGVLEHLNSDLLGRLSLVLEDLDGLLVQVQNALAGDNGSPLGRTFTGVDTLMNGSLDPILADLKQISSRLNVLSGELTEPQGTVLKVLDGDGAVYGNLEASLKAVAGTLGNLEKVSAFLPSQMPQVAALLTELRGTLKTAEDVLVSLTNNPLLKGGIPQPVDAQSGGISPRDVPF